MNVLFLSISSLPHLAEHSISTDLLHEFRRNGHEVFVVCAKRDDDFSPTEAENEDGCRIVRVAIGKNKKANAVRKGLTTVCLPLKYRKTIKRFYGDVRFDLILYPTPPVTAAGVVRYVKKRDGARTYLLLRDIFPQNAVDLGMMKKTGPKSILYRYFRRKEKQLYAVSDRIGCMSQANFDYIIEHNPQVDPSVVEICPNAVKVQPVLLNDREKLDMRSKYGIPADKKVFVYGGNLGKPQGIPFLIDCLRAGKDNDRAFFLVVGDGTEYRQLEAFFNEESPANMKLLKRLPKDDYDRLVAACDVGLIFLDHRFTIPNFPSRLLSYLQAGLPVLACTDTATDIGTVITEGKLGWWCESSDVQRFAALTDMICRIDADGDAYPHGAIDYLAAHYNVENNYRRIVNGKV
ncbi:MAG: glycosyltransferase family 4 protein [Clostridia bacterium]|nr:glycosyltransferase family 4 protein [Clostridia bacterium]